MHGASMGTRRQRVAGMKRELSQSLQARHAKRVGVDVEIATRLALLKRLNAKKIGLHLRSQAVQGRLRGDRLMAIRALECSRNRLELVHTLISRGDQHHRRKALVQQKRSHRHCSERLKALIKGQQQVHARDHDPRILGPTAQATLTQQDPLTLQGSLFGAPEPTVNAAKNKACTGDRLNLNASDDHFRETDLSDADLSNDAIARPRRRNKGNDAIDATTAPELDQADGVDETSVDETGVDATNGNSTDEPAWAHHSQLQPEQLTPVLRHYVELKMAHPERVLLYRLGDFFECFFEDAITLSRELDLTLTGKDAGKAIGRVPMAGIPHHAAERYCSDLIRLG